MTTVPFNQISGGIVAPIFAFEVNSGGTFEAESRIVLVGHKTSAGAMSTDTPVFAASQEAVDALAGPTSILRDMYRRARANAPAEEIWIAAAPDTGTAQTWTLTVGAIPAAGGIGVVDIAGERVQIAIAAGATASTVATDLAAAVNAHYDELTKATLPVTAAAATNVVTLTAAHKGTIFADLDIWADPSVTGNLFATALTIAAATAGAGTPDLSTLFAALGDDEWTTIVCPFSDDTNLQRARDLLGDVSGRWSWSRQSYGHLWTVKTDTAAALVTWGEALTDDRHVTGLGRIASSGDATPAWGWLASYTALQAAWLHDGASGNVSRNQTGRALVYVKAPRSRSKWPSHATRNALLKARVSTWSVVNGVVAVDKAVTMSKKNALGQTDTTFRDVQALYQLVYALKFFRFRLSVEHGQKAIASTNPGGNAAISTPNDIRATFVHAYGALVTRGVLEDLDAFASAIRVERDADASNRVNVLAPLDRVNPLDVIAANAVLYSQF